MTADSLTRSSSSAIDDIHAAAHSAAAVSRNA